MVNFLTLVIEIKEIVKNFSCSFFLFVLLCDMFGYVINKSLWHIPEGREDRQEIFA